MQDKDLIKLTIDEIQNSSFLQEGSVFSDPGTGRYKMANTTLVGER
jgi:hypothetical protein